MKAYPKYKEIDLEFLHSIPAHWDIKRLKFLSSVNFSNVDKHSFEDEIPVRLCNYVDVYKNDFITPEMDFMAASATQTEIEKFVLRKSDVLITKDSESWDDIAVPAYVTKDIDGVLCGYHLAQIRSTGINGKFLFWVMCSSTLNDQYKVEAHGITRYGLGKDSIENSVIPIPSTTEQQAIADFLDCKTAQIDTLIERKQRQIDLLQEQRTALINHAVTKGLNPDVLMKDSGVDWIGETPVHWAVAPIYAKYEVQLGKMLDEKRITGTDLAPYIRNIHVRWDRIDIDNLPVMDFSPDERIKYRLEPGDLLVCEGGEVGKAAIWKGDLEECYYQKALHRVRPYKKEQDIPRFLFYVLYSAAKQGVFVATGNSNTIDHLTAEKLRHHRFSFPQYQEQKEILVWLDNKISKIDLLIENIFLTIEKLVEYRTALISEAVTGKIDVR
jgi:type I restriction enzyme, S subunit